MNGSTSINLSCVDFLAFVLYFNSLCEKDKPSLQVSISSFDSFVKSKGENLTVAFKNSRDTVIAEVKLKFTLETFTTAEGKMLKDARRSLFDTLHLLFAVNDENDLSAEKSNDILLSKSTILQAFIAQVLFNKIQYKSFLISFQKYEKHSSTKLQNPLDNNDLIDTFILVEKDRFIFPYSKEVPPSHNSNVRPFKREGGIFSGIPFANCVESSVYHFLNCLFWNPLTKKYEFPVKQKSVAEVNFPAEKELLTADEQTADESTVERKSSDKIEYSIPIQIVNFFSSKNEMKGNLSGSEWEQWHEIVENLDNGYLIKNYEPESIELFFQVAYAREEVGCCNELYTGFLNFFVLLATIFDKKELLKGIENSCFDIDGNLLKKPNADQFKTFVQKFILTITNLKSGDFEIAVPKLIIELVGKGKKPELMGVLRITRWCEENKVKFSLVTSSRHSFVGIDEAPELSLETVPKAKHLLDYFSNCSKS